MLKVIQKITHPYWIQHWKEVYTKTDIPYPRNFLADGWSIGIKENKEKDLGIIYSQVPCNMAVSFTRNQFPAHPIVIGRAHTQGNKIQALVVNSGNANVANGPDGAKSALEACKQVGISLKIPTTDVLPSSTGIIGEPFPGKILINACKTLPRDMEKQNFPAFAEAIMTTDAFPKMIKMELTSGIRITGVAKGAGMIAPNMATMLAYIVTDAKITGKSLQNLMNFVVKKSFNSISVDTDTSTNDTFCILANGASEQEVELNQEDMSLYYANCVSKKIYENYPRNKKQLNIKNNELSPESFEFLGAISTMCTKLAQMILEDGEGSSKLIEVQINEAGSNVEARQIARNIVTSPLVKTAIHGNDTNWGRIFAVIGKTPSTNLSTNKLKIVINGYKVFPRIDSSKIPKQLFATKKILIEVFLKTGEGSAVMWGCDMGKKYININAHYKS